MGSSMPDLPSLDGLSSAQLVELSEQIGTAYQRAVGREQQAVLTAQERLLGLAQQLGERQEALRRITAMSDEELTAQPCQAIRTIAAMLGQVTELGRQSVLIGAQATGGH